MKLRRIPLVCALGAALVLSGCVAGGVRHGWIMRGQVLALDNGVATVCIGTRDGAKVGQVLEVEHITINSGNSPKGTGPTFSRSAAGSVEITQLFDEHYARAKIVSGSPAVNDVVELQMK